MCGLVAVIERSAPANWQRTHEALQKIRHRGPDGDGMLGIDHQGNPVAHGDSNTRIILGFCRLSILDLSHGADQPMVCVRTGNRIVFNGEIYNFIELRAELEALGHMFKTQGDTEVILAAYAQWGEEAFAKLNGMWAIVLHEAATGDIIACRDRMGVKPLYYSCDGQRHVLASEIRTVHHAAEKTPAVNHAAAFDFLAGNHIDTTDETLFEGIVCVPAGGLWRINPMGIVTRRRYHTWNTTTSVNATPEMLRDLLTDSVRLRLRSDAPTVSLLSGGLDSSIITWLAATTGQHDARTQFVGAFSYGYTDARYAEHDEIANAQALIAALPQPIKHTIVRMDPIPTLDELLAMAATQELPSTTPSIIASWRLYKDIRAKGIKVVISGEGADELFGGYTKRYLPALVCDMLRSGNVLGAVRVLRSGHVSPVTLLRAMSWFLPQTLLVPLLKRYRPNMATLADGFWREQSARFSHVVARHRLSLAARLRSGITHNEMPEILRYADRNSMHSSVEVRLPFMDYRLVQFALSLAVSAKISAVGGKQILRNAFAAILPTDVVTQRKTHGFGNAEQHQVLAMQLAPLIARAPEAAWEFIDKKALTRALASTHIHPMVWLPVSFLLWMTAWHEQQH